MADAKANVLTVLGDGPQCVGCGEILKRATWQGRQILIHALGFCARYEQPD